jgi:hypothetical protein
MKYYVERSPNGKTWEVLDSEGYSVAYVAYDTKREAQDAARHRADDDAVDMVRAHKAGIAYWRMNRPTDATQAQLEFHARTCGWHGEQCEAWLTGFNGERKRSEGVA